MDRLYGIRPDYCLALRLIGCQEFSRRNQEFVEEHFKEIFMEREMEEEIERLEARIAALEAAFRVNMLRCFPDKTHEEIDAEIRRCAGGNDD